MVIVEPMGEMPVWRVVRQGLMTHVLLHLGAINANRGALGLRGID